MLENGTRIGRASVLYVFEQKPKDVQSGRPVLIGRESRDSGIPMDWKR